MAYVFNGESFFGPFDSKATAVAAVNHAAAEQAIEYAGMVGEFTAVQALDEMFGTDDADERDRRCDLYYSAFLNLLDGAERRILERIIAKHDDVQECHDWQCVACGCEWTGADSDCYSCAFSDSDDDGEVV